MCACGCLVVAVLIVAIVYAVMNGMWLMLTAVLIVAALLGWFGRKMFVSRR